MKAQPFRSFWPAHSHSKLVDNASNVLVGYGPDARQSLIQVNDGCDIYHSYRVLATQGAPLNRSR